MLTEVDLLIGRLAVARGWVTEERLAAAVERQDVERRAGRPERLLGMHLVEAGDLRPERLEQLLDAQMRAILQDGDRMLGATLVRNGLAPQAAVDRALAEQRTELRTRRLGEILCAEGTLTPQGLAAALRAQARWSATTPGLPAPPGLPDATFPAAGATVVPAAKGAPSPSTAGASPTPAPRTAAAAEFGRFQILAELGRGGMGVVYRAREPGLDREVALKTLRSGGLLSDDDVERFLIEAKTLARLTHPGIVPLFEWGREGERAWFTMALVEGISLAELMDGYGRIERAPTELPEILAEVRRRREPRPAGLPPAAGSARRPLPFLHAVALTRRILEALGHAHGHGVVHRDIKPSNVMITARGEPVLLDFGLARAGNHDRARSLTESGAVMGTLSYMAPEQARGDAKHADARTDLYAVGAVLYEMLAGRPALALEGNWLRDLGRIVDAEPAPLCRVQPSVPPDLGVIVHKALSKEPSRRYATCADLAEDLRRFLASEPIVARPPGRAYRMRMWVRRHRELAAAATVATLIASVVLSWSVGSRWAERRERRQILLAQADRVAQAGVDERALEQAREVAGTGTEPEAIRLRRSIALAAAELHIRQGRHEAALGALQESRNQFPGDVRIDELYRIARGLGSLTLDTNPAGAEVWIVRQEQVEQEHRAALAAHDERVRAHVRRTLDAISWGEELRLALGAGLPQGARVHAPAPALAATLPAHTGGPTRVIVRGRVEAGARAALSVWWHGAPWHPRFFERHEVRVTLGPRSTIELRREECRVTAVDLPAGAFAGGGSFELVAEWAAGCGRVTVEGKTVLETFAEWESEAGRTTGLALAGGGLVLDEIRFAAAATPVTAEPPGLPELPVLPWTRLGSTPLARTELDMGSYLVELRREGRTVRYPIHITRNRDWDAGTVRLDDVIPEGFVFVPGGPARIGGEDLAIPDFAIGAREVSKREYWGFLREQSDATRASCTPGAWTMEGPRPRQGPEDWGYGAYDPARTPDQDDQPVSFVRLDAAERYCAWLSNKTGRRFRMPSAEEWEKAARGVDGREFPWGTGLHRLRARLDRMPGRLGDPDGYFFGASPYGARHLSGQVSEWTATPFRGEAWGNVLKGGSYQTPAGAARCEAEDVLSNAFTREDLGFRVLLDLAAERR